MSIAAIHMIAQPMRTLPAQVKFEITRDHNTTVQIKANLYQVGFPYSNGSYVW